MVAFNKKQVKNTKANSLALNVFENQFINYSHVNNEDILLEETDCINYNRGGDSNGSSIDSCALDHLGVYGSY